jgi:hypothetical protein
MDHRHRLAADRLVDVDRQETAAVVVGMKEGQLLPAIGLSARSHGVMSAKPTGTRSSVSSMSSTIRRGTTSKLSQHSSIIDRQEAIDPIREATPASRPARRRHHPLERGRARQVLQPAPSAFC